MLCWQQLKLLTTYWTPDSLTSSTTAATHSSATPLRSVVITAATTTVHQWVIICKHNYQLQPVNLQYSSFGWHQIFIKLYIIHIIYKILVNPSKLLKIIKVKSFSNHRLSQSGTYLCCKTMVMETVYCTVCPFTTKLSLILTALTKEGWLGWVDLGSYLHTRNNLAR